MSPRAPGQLRPLSRPGLLLGLAGVRAAMALLVAWPLATLVAESGIGARPEGDRALFEDGGYLLLEVARLEGPTLLAAARGLLPLLAFALVVNSLCGAALFEGLNDQERLRGSELVRRSLRRAPRVLLLGAGAGLAQMLLVLLGSACAGAVPQPLARPVPSTLGQASVWLITALLLGAVGGGADLAKAALIRHDVGAPEALAFTAKLWGRRPIAVSFGWLPYAAPLVLGAALAARVAEAVDVSRAGSWRVLLVLASHQLVILAAIAGRAGWYARALRLASTHGA